MKLAAKFGATVLTACAACQTPQPSTPRRPASPTSTAIQDTDTDADGLVDERDACPDAAEDRDGINDADGCPETDADRDQVLDEDDACPNEPGGGLAREFGCPFVPPLADDCVTTMVPFSAAFTTGSTELDAIQTARLAIIAREMETLPPASRLVLIGRRTASEPINMGLRRVVAVGSVLTEHGLDPDRLGLVNRADRDEDITDEFGQAVAFRLQTSCATSPEATYDFQRPLPPRSLPASAPAMRYANLAPAACRAELSRRELPLQRDGRPTPGVATGVRFVGPLHGVSIVAPGKPTTFGVMDCRLALTLDDMTELLAGFDVVRLRIDNTYRRGAKLPNRRRRNSQHAHGLAADITALYLSDGSELNVARNWNGQRGAPVCGPEAKLEIPTEEAILLRDITCEIARRGLFHTMLTPNYDAAHENHFHFDIKRGGQYWSIH